jgi:hypothetical protein
MEHAGAPRGGRSASLEARARGRRVAREHLTIAQETTLPRRRDFP